MPTLTDIKSDILTLTNEQQINLLNYGSVLEECWYLTKNTNSMLMVLKYQLFKVDTINNFSHQHLSKTQRKLKRENFKFSLFLMKKR